MLRSSLAIIAAALLCFSCNTKKSVDENHNIIIASLNGPSSMALIKLIDSVYCENNNNIRVEIFDEPVQVRKMMLDGTADFALLPSNMGAIIYNKGIDYRLMAIPVWGTLYLFGQDSTINSWQDLKNKKVYVMARGMIPDVLFRHLLIKNGIYPEKDLTLDYSFPTHIDLANAVAAGQAGLGVISEPLVSLVMKRNNKVRALMNLNDEWNKVQGTPIAQTALLGKGSFIDSDPVMALKILSACERSVAWVNNNPDSAAVLIVKHNILPDIEVARASIPRSNMNFVRAGYISHEINDFFRVFYEMDPDIIGGKIPDEKFFY